MMMTALSAINSYHDSIEMVVIMITWAIYEVI